MENASKALLIAGGILLAILTLSLVIYMTTVTSSMADAQDAKTKSEQIAAFNREYDSYNKRKMYGTDVITVVNKAINHNKKIGLTEVDPYYVQIVIETTEDFKTTGQVVDTSKPKDNKEDMTEDEIKNITGKTEIKTTLLKGIHNLGDWKKRRALYG